jgi:hypothetical protein
MTQPVLVAVADDGEVLAALQAALARRFGADYQVLAERSPRRRWRRWSGCAKTTWRSR